MNNISFHLFLAFISYATTTIAFNANLPPTSLILKRHHDASRYTTGNTNNHDISPLFMAGFGGGGGGGGAKAKAKKGKKTSSSLKPKAQWDRYYDLKKYTIVPVAVRVEGSGDEEWLEVGRIKSEEDAFTEIAIARQKALIAEHSRRLYPLKVLAKDRVEWAYYKTNDNDDDENDGEWIALSKDAGKGELPDGIDKKIGFEGKADPKTGFYCHYNAGRLVDRSDEAMVKAKQ
mmetsp:Transcript_9041/g.12858  ORF Transcript_9041/g.12858 Transcript_9041/m.12858 type:complete len:232 (-) Transcript_9041:152-847(-)